jgi:hypothetical protein
MLLSAFLLHSPADVSVACDAEHHCILLLAAKWVVTNVTGSKFEIAYTKGVSVRGLPVWLADCAVS